MEQKKLYRSCKSYMLGGVAGGLGEYFEVDANVVRLIFVLLTFAGGASVILYIIAWLIIPIDPSCGTKSDPKEEMKEAVHNISSKVEKTVKENPSDSRLILGLIVLVLGVTLLAKNLTGINFWHNFWPVGLIIIGLIIMIADEQSRKNK